MRHYQWDDASHAVRQFAGHELTFCDDIPGGVLCECGYCGEEIEVLEKTEECPKCKGNIVFPRADW